MGGLDPEGDGTSENDSTPHVQAVWDSEFLIFRQGF
jgi:hypothetical protein